MPWTMPVAARLWRRASGGRGDNPPGPPAGASFAAASFSAGASACPRSSSIWFLGDEARGVLGERARAVRALDGDLDAGAVRHERPGDVPRLVLHGQRHAARLAHLDGADEGVGHGGIGGVGEGAGVRGASASVAVEAGRPGKRRTVLAREAAPGRARRHDARPAVHVERASPGDGLGFQSLASRFDGEWNTVDFLLPAGGEHAGR